MGFLFGSGCRVFHACSAGQCSAVQCSAVQCSVVQCSAVQCSAVHCSAVQCSAVHCTWPPSSCHNSSCSLDHICNFYNWMTLQPNTRHFSSVVSWAGGLELQLEGWTNYSRYNCCVDVLDMFPLCSVV